MKGFFTGLFVVILLMLDLSACRTAPASQTISFPRQKKTNGEWAAMDALAGGKLVLVDDCIRLMGEESDFSYLLIWPPDFSYLIENEAVKINNENGEVVASVGDKVRMSGGGIELPSQLGESIREQIPSQCTGPYWKIGYEFAVVNSSP